MSMPQQIDMGANKWLILVNIMIGTFMAVLDSTVVNTALPVIMGTLGASINTAEWILTGYMLSIGAILPAAAWFSNRFGFKKIYLLSIIVFTFGSFMCGNSSSIEELIFWRIIEGLGCGAIMPVGMTIISNVFPAEQRGTALGFWAVASAASVSFGPFFGGYIVDTLNWNYIFFINVPIGIFCVFLTMVLLKEYKRPDVPRFDIPGFITSSIFLPLFMYGLTEVNSSTNTQGWNSPVVLASMWGAAILFVLFLYIEFTTTHPIINLRIFKDRNFTITNIVLFIFGVGMFGSAFLVPLYMQNGLGYTAMLTGMAFIPRGVIQGIMSPLSGAISNHINPKILIVLGLAIMSLSFLLNTNLSFLTDDWTMIVSLFLRGLGMGIVFTPLLTVSLSNIKPEDIADASSITNIIRQMGGSFGVAYFSHILTNRTAFHTQRYAESLSFGSEVYDQTINNLSNFTQSAAGVSLEQAKKIAEQLIIKRVDLEAYIQGINDDFILSFLLTAVCIIPVFWITIKKAK